MQRESRIPLLVGALVAVALHVLVVPLSARALLSSPSFGFDLIVRAVDAPHAADAGETVTVSVTVRNRGPRGAGATAAGQLYLSADEALSAEDVLLGSLDFDPPVAADNSQGFDIAATLPRRAGGAMHLIATVSDTFSRTDDAAARADDVLAVPIIVRPLMLPDLAATKLTTPRTVRMGESMSLSYTIDNRGRVASPASWHDRVYLSEDGEVSDGDRLMVDALRTGPLAPGEARVYTVESVQIPPELEGEFYVIVVTDAAAAIPELDEANNIVMQRFTILTDAEAQEDEQKDELRPGRDVPESASVAWISYEDYQELIARRGRVDQSATQAHVDPTPEAPLNTQPTRPQSRTQPQQAQVALLQTPQPSDQPAQAEADRQADPTKQVEATAELTQPTDPIDQRRASAPDSAEGVPTDQRAADAAVEMQGEPTTTVAAQVPVTVTQPDGPPLAPTQPTPEQSLELAMRPTIDAEADAVAITDPTRRPEASTDAPEDGEPVTQQEAQTDAATDGSPTTRTPADAAAEASDPVEAQPAPGSTPQPAVVPRTDPTTTPAQSGAEPSPPAPTAAPRTESESDAESRDPQPLRVQPGRVLTAHGLEIRTYRPQFSIATVLTAVPRNPVVTITFQPDGTVSNVKFVTSSGYLDIDGPLMTAIYRWKATGEKLEKITQPFDIGPMTVLLVGD